MTQGEMSPEDVAKTQHKEWLAHPVTQDLLKNLKKFEISCYAKSTTKSSDFSIPDVQFRLNAHAALTTQTLTTLITSTDEFINKTKQKVN